MVLSGVPREKSPVTPPGIDPRTVRLVAQLLNHYATQVPACVFMKEYHVYKTAEEPNGKILFYKNLLPGNIKQLCGRKCVRRQLRRRNQGMGQNKIITK